MPGSIWREENENDTATTSKNEEVMKKEIDVKMYELYMFVLLAHVNVAPEEFGKRCLDA